MKVLICDDQPKRAADIQKAVEAAKQNRLTCELLTDVKLTEQLTKLFDAVNSYLTKPKTEKFDARLLFDKFDIVLLDNNLSGLEIKGARLTAESIAGYIRAFTTAPYSISLNKNPEVDFDLRYLVGDFETRADLALNTEHLKIPGLWSRESSAKGTEFLPWYWPPLSSVAKHRRQQIDFVHRRLDKAIVSAFGMTKELLGFLSPHAKGFLSPEADDDVGSLPVDKVSFWEFFQSRGRSLPARNERKDIVAAWKNGSKDAANIISRVVAADLDLWFRRDLVGPQDALVDIPHLLMRMPFLLGRHAGEIERWNRSIAAKQAPYGLDAELYEQHLSKALFKHADWVSSPCFLWPKLKANDTLNQLFSQADQSKWVDAVFCEDRSTFIARSPSNSSNAPVEFAVEFEGSWGRRHVSRISGISYAPRSRFAV